MKHLLLLVALAVGIVPVFTGATAPNGATLLAILLLAAWAVLAWRSRSHKA